MKSVSEISWPMKFFDRYFPVLGSEFGLGALGIFQCLCALLHYFHLSSLITHVNSYRISTQILSHHVDDFSLVSAFFLFALGCLNMLLGLIYRASVKPKRSVTSWRNESKGVLPTHTGSSTSTRTQSAFTNGTPGTYFPNSGSTLQRGGSEHSTYKCPIPYSENAGYGFGTRGEKAAGLRGFILQKPDEALPRYMTPPPALSRNGTKRSSSSSFESPSHRRSDSRGSDDGYSRSNRSPSPNEGRRIPHFKSSSTAL